MVLFASAPLLLELGMPLSCCSSDALQAHDTLWCLDATSPSMLQVVNLVGFSPRLQVQIIRFKMRGGGGGSDIQGERDGDAG